MENKESLGTQPRPQPDQEHAQQQPGKGSVDKQQGNSEQFGQAGEPGLPKENGQGWRPEDTADAGTAAA